MLRRAASGHIPATQLSKFAAASRIALAVIKGWPEAPSSPLQGNGPLPDAGAAPGCAAAGAGWFAWVEPVKMLLRKLSGPPPLEDCACASPPHSNAAASMTAALRRLADNTVRLVMLYPCRARGPAFRRPCHGFHQLNKAEVLLAEFLASPLVTLREPYIRLCSRPKNRLPIRHRTHPPLARTRPDNAP